MGFIETLLVCIALFMVFPKGFKYLVGTWMGAMVGAMFWWLAIIGWDCFFTRGSFVAFVLVGIIAGWVFAAKG